MKEQDKKIIFWLANDKTLSEIAIILGISVNAAKLRAHKLRKELEVNTNAGLVAKALKLGIIRNNQLYYYNDSWKKYAASFLCLLFLLPVFGDEHRVRSPRQRRLREEVIELVI